MDIPEGFDKFIRKATGLASETMRRRNFSVYSHFLEAYKAGLAQGEKQGRREGLLMASATIRAAREISGNVDITKLENLINKAADEL